MVITEESIDSPHAARRPHPSWRYFILSAVFETIWSAHRILTDLTGCLLDDTMLQSQPTLWQCIVRRAAVAWNASRNWKGVSVRNCTRPVELTPGEGPSPWCNTEIAVSGDDERASPNERRRRGTSEGARASLIDKRKVPGRRKHPSAFHWTCGATCGGQ